MRKWKFTILLLVFIFSGMFVFAQAFDGAFIFSNTQGIKQEKTIFYELEGYHVFVQVYKSGFDNKSVERLSKKFFINHQGSPVKDSLLPENKFVVTREKKTSKTELTGIYYFFPHGKNEVKVVGLLTPNTRDEQLERFFVQSLIEDKVPEEVYTPNIIKAIKFAGRTIVLSPVCRWIGTRNVECPDMGQMNWAEFRTMERAEEMTRSQQDIINARNPGVLLSENSIGIVFEGKENSAIKLVYSITDPKFVGSGKNHLVVYFVTAEVRGKYVSCVLSFFTNNPNQTVLPPLLRQVMGLKD